MSIINISRQEKKEKILSWIIAILSFVIVYGIIFYVTCPAINFREFDFYIGIIIALVAAAFISGMFAYMRERKVYYTANTGISISGAAFVGIAAVIALVLVVLIAVSSPLFNAKRFRNRITVVEKSEEEFSSDLPSINDINKIALMDTTSASKLGDRVLGTLTDVVSQFEVDNYYTVEIQGNPMKIAPLKYGSFFKWNSNKKTGIPGYVLVNPITSEAEFVKVEGGINYAPSAYFGKDLIRHIRMKYPTKIFGDYTFQVDNDGNVYWIITTLKKNTAIGCESPEGAILCNAVDGNCEYYALSDIPEWVDLVFSGEMIEELYDDYGRYVHGYINFSKKGITSTTKDYGYICVGSDIYVYTGITSIAADESNLGFIMVNSRTGEYSYYPLSGAEEYSAMSAAEGAMQNYGYKASFPSLVNVNGIPTYVCVLKDSNNLVKMYAMINVKNYTIVSVETTLKECLNSYEKALANAGTSANLDKPSNNDGTKILKDTFVITNIQYINVEGNTYVYLKGDNGKVYKQLFSKNEKLILLETGDKVMAEYTYDEDIISVISVEKAK